MDFVFQILQNIELDRIADLIGGAFEKQITQFSLAFMLAAWFHSGRVRKEMKTQFGFITNAINNVATTLGKDLAAQKEIIGTIGKSVSELKEEVSQINTRVSTLEKQ